MPESVSAASSLFERRADGAIVPTELARGPWDPRSLHGGPVAALIADAVEELPADGIDWFVSRLTVELERPVTLQPLSVESEITRPGRKVSVVDVTVRLVETSVALARGRALRIREDDVALPHDDEALAPMLATGPAPPGPQHGTAQLLADVDYRAFHNDAVEHRFVPLDRTNGEVLDWIRMLVPVLPDRPLTPLQRVAGAADFANGISSALPFETHLFVNPDLTIHLFQPLLGEWVGMSSNTHYGRRGVGMSDTALYDINGRIGRSNQSLLLDLR